MGQAVTVNRDVPVEQTQVQQVMVNTQGSVSQTTHSPVVHQNRQIVQGTGYVNNTVGVTSNHAQVVGHASSVSNQVVGSQVVGTQVVGGGVVGGSTIVGGGVVGGSTIVGGGIVGIY